MPQRIVLNRAMLTKALGDRWSDADLDRALALLSKNEGRFPTGMRDMPVDLISAIQRERILAGMRTAANDLGYQRMTVQDVLIRSVISRPTFYTYFKDKENCFLTAFDATARRMEDEVASAAEGGDGSRRLRHGLQALLRFAADEPEAARMVLVAARASSMVGRRRRDQLIDRLTALIAGKDGHGSTHCTPPVVAGGVAAGIEAVLSNRLQRGETADLESLLPSVLFFALLPYEGLEAAAEEAVLE